MNLIRNIRIDLLRLIALDWFDWFLSSMMIYPREGVLLYNLIYKSSNWITPHVVKFVCLYKEELIYYNVLITAFVMNHSLVQLLLLDLLELHELLQNWNKASSSSPTKIIDKWTISYSNTVIICSLLSTVSNYKSNRVYLDIMATIGQILWLISNYNLKKWNYEELVFWPQWFNP